MKVNVSGHGLINFPDSMSEEEVRDVLKQFEPKKDDTIPSLLKSIESLVKNQKPLLVKEPSVLTVEKQMVVKEPQVVTVERVITEQVKVLRWDFVFERDDEGRITAAAAFPEYE